MQQKRPNRKFNNTVPSLQKLLLGVTNNHFICVSDIEFRDNTQNINDNVMMKIPLVFKLQRDQMIVRDSDGHSRSRCIVADSLELHGCFKVNFSLSSCGLLLHRGTQFMKNTIISPKKYLPTSYSTCGKVCKLNVAHDLVSVC